jgi:hypothetical protein
MISMMWLPADLIYWPVWRMMQRTENSEEEEEHSNSECDNEEGNVDQEDLVFQEDDEDFE